MNKVGASQILAINNSIIRFTELIQHASQGQFLTINAQGGEEQWAPVWWLERLVRNLLSPCIRGVHSTTVKCVLCSIDALQLSPTQLDRTSNETSGKEEGDTESAFEELTKSQRLFRSTLNQLRGNVGALPETITSLETEIVKICTIFANSQKNVHPTSYNVTELAAARMHAQESEATVRRYQETLAALQAKAQDAKEQDAKRGSIRVTSSLSLGGERSATTSDPLALERLKKELETQKQAVQKLKAALATELGKSDTQNSTIDALNKEINTLKLQITEKERALKRAQETLTALNRQVGEETRAKQDALGKLRAAEEENAKLRNRISDLEKQIADFEIQIQESQVRIGQFEDAEQGLRGKLEALEAEKATWQKTLEAKEKALADFKAGIAEERNALLELNRKLTEQNQKLRTELLAMQGALEKSILELNNALADVTRYKKLYQDTLVEKSRLEDRCRVLTEDNDSLRARCKENQTQLATAKKMDLFATTNQTLEEQLKEKGQALSEAQKQLGKQEADLREQARILELRNKRIEELIRDKNTLEEQIRGLQATIKRLTEENERLRAKEGEFKQKEEALAKAQKEVQVLKDAVGNKDVAITSFQARMELLTNEKGEANRVRDVAVLEIEKLKKERTSILKSFQEKIAVLRQQQQELRAFFAKEFADIQQGFSGQIKELQNKLNDLEKENIDKEAELHRNDEQWFALQKTWTTEKETLLARIEVLTKQLMEANTARGSAAAAVKAEEETKADDSAEKEITKAPSRRTVTQARDYTHRPLKNALKEQPKKNRTLDKHTALQLQQRGATTFVQRVETSVEYKKKFRSSLAGTKRILTDIRSGWKGRTEHHKDAFKSRAEELARAVRATDSNEGEDISSSLTPVVALRRAPAKRPKKEAKVPFKSQSTLEPDQSESPPTSIAAASIGPGPSVAAAAAAKPEGVVTTVAATVAALALAATTPPIVNRPNTTTHTGVSVKDLIVKMNTGSPAKGPKQAAKSSTKPKAETANVQPPGTLPAVTSIATGVAAAEATKPIDGVTTVETISKVE